MIALAERLYDGPWYFLEIEEIIRRTYKTIPQRIRPDDQMVGHTGFLIFARAVEREERGERDDSGESGPDDDLDADAPDE